MLIAVYLCISLYLYTGTWLLVVNGNCWHVSLGTQKLLRQKPLGLVKTGGMRGWILLPGLTQCSPPTPSLNKRCHFIEAIKLISKKFKTLTNFLILSYRGHFLLSYMKDKERSQDIYFLFWSWAQITIKQSVMRAFYQWQALASTSITSCSLS